MSIYISGVEMPKRCLDCPFMVSREHDDCILQSDEANASFYEWDDMKKNCPLIPVQEHGRLIDADAMLKKHYDGDVNGNIILRAAIITPEFVKNLPTVIPASKEGRNE